MEHLEIYMLTTFYRERLDLDNFQIKEIMEKKLGIKYIIMPEHIEQFEKYVQMKPPSNGHLVHALKHMGFQPKFIAEYLKIDSPNVSYYIKNPPKRPYVNFYWKVNMDSVIEKAVQDANFDKKIQFKA